MCRVVLAVGGLVSVGGVLGTGGGSVIKADARADLNQDESGPAPSGSPEERCDGEIGLSSVWSWSWSEVCGCDTVSLSPLPNPWTIISQYCWLARTELFLRVNFADNEREIPERADAFGVVAPLLIDAALSMDVRRLIGRLAGRLAGRDEK